MLATWSSTPILVGPARLAAGAVSLGHRPLGASTGRKGRQVIVWEGDRKIVMTPERLGLGETATPACSPASSADWGSSARRK